MPLSALTKPATDPTRSSSTSAAATAPNCSPPPSPTSMSSAGCERAAVVRRAARRPRPGGAAGRRAVHGAAGDGAAGADAGGRLDLTPWPASTVPGGVVRRRRLHRAGGRGPGRAGDGRAAADEPARPGSKADEAGAAFIFREGIESAMEREASARRLTLAWPGGRRTSPRSWRGTCRSDDAKSCSTSAAAPAFTPSPACSRTPTCGPIVWDRPEVLKVGPRDGRGVRRRRSRGPRRPATCSPTRCPAGADVDPAVEHPARLGRARVPGLIGRCAGACPPAGRLLIHDVFLDDDLGGPLPIALYSPPLFTLTEGRAYSAREYRGWLREAGLEAGRPRRAHTGPLRRAGGSEVTTRPLTAARCAGHDRASHRACP